MKTVIFNGEKEAAAREARLKLRVVMLGKQLKLVTVVFHEDLAGQTYARLKGEACERVGIGFEQINHSMTDDLRLMIQEIHKACRRPEVTGVMIQKPAKKIYVGRGEACLTPTDFGEWWRALADAIVPQKDPDCLTQVNLTKVDDGSWKIVPATVRAILEVIEIARRFKNYDLRFMNKAVVIGRSEIVGRPLAAVLTQKGYDAQLLGSKTVDLAAKVKLADLVVSATGIRHLLRGEWIKPGAIVIDVGSPYPEVEFEAAVKRAGFITPVPYGVGPMTVVSLLENLVKII